MTFKWWFDPEYMRYKIVCDDDNVRISYECWIDREEFVRCKEGQLKPADDALAPHMYLSRSMTQCWNHVRVTSGCPIKWDTFTKIVSEKLNYKKEIDIDTSRWKEIMQSYCKEIEHA